MKHGDLVTFKEMMRPDATYKDLIDKGFVPNNEYLVYTGSFLDLYVKSALGNEVRMILAHGGDTSMATYFKLIPLKDYNGNCMYHSWVKYVGITHVFEYCESCNTKRETIWRPS